MLKVACVAALLPLTNSSSATADICKNVADLQKQNDILRKENVRIQLEKENLKLTSEIESGRRIALTHKLKQKHLELLQLENETASEMTYSTSADSECSVEEQLSVSELLEPIAETAAGDTSAAYLAAT